MQKKSQNKNTFQDNLFDILKTFWMAGYAYRHNQEDPELFVGKLWEDFSMLSQEEFLAKYKYYEIVK